jgi:GNAT superfamily N-acetyltransferase
MIALRNVRPDDCATICSHRRRMFAEDGVDAATLDALAEPFATWLQERLDDGRYFGFVAEDDGVIVAGIGLFVLDWPPHFLHPRSAERGYILNVFVEPEYRGRGLAAELMGRSEEEFRHRGIVYEVLHASKKGRPVYEKLGWTASAEMSKRLVSKRLG